MEELGAVEGLQLALAVVELVTLLDAVCEDVVVAETVGDAA